MTALAPIESFIARWQGVTASELATAQSFVIDLCRLLELDVPHPTPEQDYMFERPVSFRHGDGGSSPGRIDCYKRGCFVLEAKKLKVGAGETARFDDARLGFRLAFETIYSDPPWQIVRLIPEFPEVRADMRGC